MHTNILRSSPYPLRRWTRVSAVACAGLTLGLVAACGGNSSPSAGATSGTLVIGSVQTMTGPSAQFGQSVTDGAQKAIDEINAKGGVKVGNVSYQLSLDTGDDTNDPARGVAQFKKLTGKGEKLVIGPGFSAVSNAIVADIDRADAILTITGGPLAEPTLAKHPNVYQTQISPSAHAAAATWFLAKHEGYKTLGLIADTTSTFDGTDFPAAMDQLMPKFGLSIIKRVETKGTSSSDYSAQLLALANAHPDAVVSAQTSAPNALIVKQARQAGYTWPIYATAGAAPLEVGIAGDALNGTFDIAGLNLPAMVKNNLASAVALNNDYKAKHGGADNTDPGGTYTNGYAAIYAYAAAVANAGTVTDVTKIEKALSSVKISSLPDLVQAKYIAQGGSAATFYNGSHAAECKAIIVQWQNQVAQPYVTYEGQTS